MNKQVNQCLKLHQPLICIKDKFIQHSFSSYVDYSIYILGCGDKLPHTCNFPSNLNTCSKILAFGRSHDYSTEDVCEAPWTMIADEVDGISCTSNTNGNFKDTCKVSCNESCGGSVFITFDLFS